MALVRFKIKKIPLNHFSSFSAIREHFHLTSHHSNLDIQATSHVQIISLSKLPFFASLRLTMEQPVIEIVASIKKDHMILQYEILIVALTLRNCIAELEPSASYIVIDELVEMESKLRGVLEEMSDN